MKSDLLALVSAINTKWLKLQSVIEERAADPSMWAQPGGRTGLLKRQAVVLGSGPYAQVVEEYSADCELLAEMRALERIAASLLVNDETAMR